MTDTTDYRIVGRVPFTDGVERDVYEDANGRQWVVGYSGERVYGVWLPPSDEPVFAEAGTRVTFPGAETRSWCPPSG
jgi:hypothetical protein